MPNQSQDKKPSNQAGQKPAKIPYEPGSRSKKKVEKKPDPSVQAPESLSTNSGRSESGIPPDVNKRIVRRMALFCGIPTSLGFLTLIVSYILVSKHLAELPNSAVVLVSMLFLGLGVLGLSYGAISASWEEGKPGSWWGWQEFSQNFGYLTAAWKSKGAEQNKASE